DRPSPSRRLPAGAPGADEKARRTRAGGPGTGPERAPSAPFALLFFLFALRARLAARVLAGPGRLAAAGAFVGLGIVPGLLGLVLGQRTLAALGLALLGQRRDGDGRDRHRGGHCAPDQASVHGVPPLGGALRRPRGAAGRGSCRGPGYTSARPAPA